MHEHIPASETRLYGMDCGRCGHAAHSTFTRPDGTLAVVHLDRRLPNCPPPAPREEAA